MIVVRGAITERDPLPRMRARLVAFLKDQFVRTFVVVMDVCQLAAGMAGAFGSMTASSWIGLG
jgi:hypothetical protein